jgi:hypothetical protein
MQFRLLRFMKGVFNMKPSLPRYATTRDAKIVLEFLRKLTLNDIDLKTLSLEVTALLALLSGQTSDFIGTTSVPMPCY